VEEVVYNFTEIEQKWQRVWTEKKAFQTGDAAGKPYYYCLVMFPYPSGKIHMGHVRNYVIGDVVARYKRACGYNVFHPIGWDAFGMPAENAAIKHGTHPAKWTYANIDNMRKQLMRMGISYDLSHELATCSPEFYRWNQWFFLQFYKRGLAYKRKASVNWCPKCQTVLANEQATNGKCWRCDSLVEQKDIAQWFFKIRDYAQRLLDGLKDIKRGWPERVLLMQEHWIGESTGAEVVFKLNGELPVKVFTTRPDTLFGATFMVLAPEHTVVQQLIGQVSNRSQVEEYVSKSRRKTVLERTALDREKTGVPLEGVTAVNPVNGKRIPVWLADYVLTSYGTGAIMSVPAHDQRDFEFAKKFGLDIIEVIRPVDEKQTSLPANAYGGDGVMVNSGEYNGIPAEEFKKKIVGWLKEKGVGEFRIEYRLRDWLISRQRYWGTPIPVIYCPKCGAMPVPEKDLPVVLPENVPFSGTGESPLAKSEEFVNTKCPGCGIDAKRETDTMDTFVDSSWYYLRYCDNKNAEKPFELAKIKQWMPVTQYIGGIEHACMHLIYSRFFHKVLHDLGLVDNDEPFANLLNQGMVTLEGSAMSKSRGNIVEPDTVMVKYGVDTIRTFVMFASPPEKDLDWSDAWIEGIWRFLSRVWRLVVKYKALNGLGEVVKVEPKVCTELVRRYNIAVKRVTLDIDNRYQFNTAIAAVMELTNAITEYQGIGDAVSGKAIEVLLKILNPFAPHMTSELWEYLGKSEDIIIAPWPKYDESAIATSEIEIPVQVNGKLRGKVVIPAEGWTDQQVKDCAMGNDNVKSIIGNQSVSKIIYVPKKMVNIVVK